jgi:universal stress protein E
MLDRIVADATARGVKADKVVRLGTPHEQLSKVAAEGNYDLLVVGTRTRGRLTRVLFGSTAQKLIRSAPCAVWVVKPASVREIREIAVATDLSDASQPALMAGVEVARALNAKLYVVHAVDISELSFLLVAGVTNEEILAARTRLIDSAEAALNLQLTATDYRTLPHGIKLEIVEGSPADVIPKFVADNEVDILVMGTHGRGGIARAILGNTAERILPSLDCSVIAVKPHGFVSHTEHPPA